MLYRTIYFKECNHVQIVFEKNAEFNVRQIVTSLMSGL